MVVRRVLIFLKLVLTLTGLGIMLETLIDLAVDAYANENVFKLVFIIMVWVSVMLSMGDLLDAVSNKFVETYPDDEKWL